MTHYIVLGIKVGGGPLKRCRVENCDLDDKVENLRDKASKECELSSDILELLHHGRVLDGDKSIRDSGIRPGEMVHVLRRSEQGAKVELPPIQDSDVQEFFALTKALGLPNTLSAFTSTMNFLISSTDSFLKLTPELVDDPVAMNFLCVPELVFRLMVPATFSLVATKHPALIHTLVKIFKGIDYQPPYQIVMESDEDDDDVVGGDGDDEDNAEDGQELTGGALITPEQLSAALAFAGLAGAASSSGAGSSDITTPGYRDFLGSLLAVDTPTPSGSAGTSRPLITSDMVSSALSQAAPGSSSARAAPPAESPASTSEETTSTRQFTAQLRRMQEMGLVDNRINLRALIICSGDVSAAINLVFSGAIAD